MNPNKTWDPTDVPELAEAEPTDWDAKMDLTSIEAQEQDLNRLWDTWNVLLPVYHHPTHPDLVRSLLEPIIETLKVELIRRGLTLQELYR